MSRDARLPSGSLLGFGVVIASSTLVWQGIKQAQAFVKAHHAVGKVCCYPLLADVRTSVHTLAHIRDTRPQTLRDHDSAGTFTSTGRSMSQWI